MHIYFNPNWNPREYYSAIKGLAILYEQVWIWSPSFEHIEQHLDESPFTLFESVDTQTGKPILVPAGRQVWFEQSRPAISESHRLGLQRIAMRCGGILDAEYESGYRAVESVWSDESRRAQLVQIASEVKPHFCPSMLREIEGVADRQNRPIEWAIANAYVQDYLAICSLRNPCPLMSTDIAHGYRILGDAMGREPSSRTIVRLVNEGFTLPDLPKGLAAADIEDVVEFLAQSETIRWSDVVEFRRRYGQPLREWIQRVRKANQRSLPEIATDAFRRVDEYTRAATVALTGAFSGLSGLVVGGEAGAGVGGGFGVALGIVLAIRYRATIGRVFAKLAGEPADQFLLETAAWKTGLWR